MDKRPALDIAAAHKHFAAECFNQAWELIDKPTRTAQEDQEMLLLSMASAWHWTQRPDCTSENLSVAYWQLARIYTLLKQIENARRYGRLCLEASQRPGTPPFCLAYAYEALARAEMAAGERAKMAEYVAQSRRVAEHMSDAESKKMVLADLATIV